MLISTVVTLDISRLTRQNLSALILQNLSSWPGLILNLIYEFWWFYNNINFIPQAFHLLLTLSKTFRSVANHRPSTSCTTHQQPKSQTPKIEQILFKVSKAHQLIAYPSGHS